MESSDPVDTPMVEKSKLDMKNIKGKASAIHTIHGILGHLIISQPVDQTLHLLYACVPAYADADHAGCQDTRRSTSRNIMSITKNSTSPSRNNAKDWEFVPAIYMHEFWATISYHKHCIKLKMNKKNYSFDLETFRDMPQICPNLPGKKFEDPPEILAFIRKLGYSRNMKSLSDVKVETLPQPWRTFGTIINKYLSGKVTGLGLLRLSRAQIMWGMYYQKNVDYVYLLWEDLVYQIENKEVNKNKYMYYPRFTKVINNHFMSKDQSIPRRNKVDWHMANNDPILTTIRFIPKHETVQKYSALPPDTLTNQAMKESDTYKTYHDFATRKVIPKPKYVRRSTREKIDQTPTASLGKRLKATAKVAKSGKKKQPAQGLETLSEIALSEALKKNHDEDDDDEVSLSKDDDENANNEDDDGQYDDNEQTESENDGEDFVHPKFSIHDEEERQDEEGDNVEGEELDDEDTNEKADMNELYMDVNVNLEGRVTEMTDALLANQSSSVSSGFISNMLNLNLDTGIDSILNLNNESTSLVDVPVTLNVEMPLSSLTTLPPPPIPLIQPQQQTPVPTPIIVPSTSLQNLVTFGSLFKFEDRVKALEGDFSEFKQTNLFAEAVSSIIYFKVQVKEQVTKILPRIKKSVNEQLEAEVLICPSNEAKTSHVIAANLSELELKKILIEKMEDNRSINRLNTVTLKRRRDDEDEDEEPSAGSNRGSKRRRAGKEPESTSAPKEKTSKSTGKSKEGSKSHQKSTGKSAQAEEPIHAGEDLEEPQAHQRVRYRHRII
ncbi:hypothetical protein Tco_0210470 [Tanacetum coccineum]